MTILVIDIGGSHVKLQTSDASSPREFDSGREMTPSRFLSEVQRVTQGWTYDVVAVGFPGRVDKKGPVAEPGNLGDGWVGYDFSAALGKPARVVNDAAMQAIGAYDGGRMLFLGLGTGLGSALVIERVVVNLELGCLPWGKSGEPLFYRVGREGLAKDGKEKWLQAVHESTAALRDATSADYIVLGGGNASLVDPLPEHTRRGGNEDAIKGGFALWKEWVEPHDRPASPAWRVVG